MNVGELIEKLLGFDKERTVLIPDSKTPTHGGQNIGEVILLKGGAVKLCEEKQQTE